MAELHLSLRDCNILTDTLKRSNKSGKIFDGEFRKKDREHGQGDEMVGTLTIPAYVITNILVSAFQLRHIWGSDSFVSQKQVDRLIEVLDTVLCGS